MPIRRSRAVTLLLLLALAAVSFGTGVSWGLPSRDADPFLFGNRTPWTGEEIMRLAGPWQPAGDRGSDRPQKSAGPATLPTVVNATDADRAEIVRRYRLYSNQPDEMITFRSLSRMRPTHGDLDPRLYQYGGLWIYPVGGLLRLAAAAHLLTLRTDLAFYLDHPEAFARFYVVARLYSAAWGLVGVIVVFGMVAELMTPVGAPDLHPGLLPTRRTLVAATAAGIYAVMPVVVNGAHEAKPHLAGTVLTLATVWAAARYVRAGRGWVVAGAFAGAAAGMVLTGVVAVAVLPVMAWLRPDHQTDAEPTRPARFVRRSLLAGLVAAVVFVATNPYLPFDLLAHRDRVTSNLGNTAGMYHPTAAGATVLNAGRLMVAGTSPVPAIVAVVGAILLVRRRGTGWLLVVPAVAVAVPFALLAAGKPAEYARFALTLDVAIGVLAATAVAHLPLRPREGLLAGALLVACTALYSLPYDLNFLADAGPRSTRLAAARQLAGQATPGRALVVTADPAPYGLPPVDLFIWRIILQPATGPAADVGPNGLAVRPTDRVSRGLPSPISWANKPFDIVPAPGRR
jgi:hypothetical protein